MNYIVINEIKVEEGFRVFINNNDKYGNVRLDFKGEGLRKIYNDLEEERDFVIEVIGDEEEKEMEIKGSSENGLEVVINENEKRADLKLQEADIMF